MKNWGAGEKSIYAGKQETAGAFTTDGTEDTDGKPGTIQILVKTAQAF